MPVGGGTFKQSFSELSDLGRSFDLLVVLQTSPAKCFARVHEGRSDCVACAQTKQWGPFTILWKWPKTEDWDRDIISTYLGPWYCQYPLLLTVGWVWYSLQWLLLPNFVLTIFGWCVQCLKVLQLKTYFVYDYSNFIWPNKFTIFSQPLLGEKKRRRRRI